MLLDWTPSHVNTCLERSCFEIKQVKWDSFCTRRMFCLDMFYHRKPDDSPTICPSDHFFISKLFCEQSTAKRKMTTFVHDHDWKCLTIWKEVHTALQAKVSAMHPICVPKGASQSFTSFSVDFKLSYSKWVFGVFQLLNLYLCFIWYTV